MTALGITLKKEVREFIPVVVFFFLAFQLLALTASLIAMEHGIRVSGFLTAAVMALIVAKVVIIADHLRFLNLFPGKPLVWTILWKSAVYFVAVLCVRYLEQLFHAWRKTGSFSEANRTLLQEIVWPHFWAVQLWLMVLLVMYCSFRELAHALGKHRVFSMFFHEPRESGVHDQVETGSNVRRAGSS